MAHDIDPDPPTCSDERMSGNRVSAIAGGIVATVLIVCALAVVIGGTISILRFLFP